MQELNNDLQAAQESAKAARGQESSLKQEVNRLNQELQRSQRLQRRLQSEKEEQEKDIQELQKQIKRLRGALQVSHTVSPPHGHQPFACIFVCVSLWWGKKFTTAGFGSERIRYFRLEMSREHVDLFPVERRHKLWRHFHKRLLSANHCEHVQVDRSARSRSSDKASRRFD